MHLTESPPFSAARPIGYEVVPCSHVRPDDRYNTLLHGILSTTEIGLPS